jgi:hypothetical protein
MEEAQILITANHKKTFYVFGMPDGKIWVHPKSIIDYAKAQGIKFNLSAAKNLLTDLQCKKNQPSEHN